jgi:hypothetical protein
MVKIDEVPIEKGRIPLDQLSDFMKFNGHSVTLIALSEETVEAQDNKTGGLKIELFTGKNFNSKYDINKKSAGKMLYEDGLKVTQKYSKIAGGMLVKSLEANNIGDTKALQEKFWDYELENQRTGYARLIPKNISKLQPEV